jgi:hypothetical protein
MRIHAVCRSAKKLPSRLRAKVPEKRANFNSADRLWGGGAPSSNNWASGAGLSLRLFVVMVLAHPVQAAMHQKTLGHGKLSQQSLRS